MEIMRIMDWLIQMLQFFIILYAIITSLNLILKRIDDLEKIINKKTNIFHIDINLSENTFSTYSVNDIDEEEHLKRISKNNIKK